MANVSETYMRCFRELLARDVNDLTKQLPDDDPFSRGLIAGLDIGNRSLLRMFDTLFPDFKPKVSKDVTA